MSSPIIRRRTRPTLAPVAANVTAQLESTAVQRFMAPPNSRLQVVEQSISAIRPSPRHARRHPKSQIAKIAASISAFGFNTPILVDAAGEIIAGHARLEAAKQLSLTMVPTIVLSDLPEEKVRALRVADNKTADGAEWAFDILKSEFEFLGAIDIDLPELTGFATAEIDTIISGATDTKNEDDPADRLPEMAEDGAAITRLGDLWLLGEHRLYCGDAKD